MLYTVLQVFVRSITIAAVLDNLNKFIFIRPLKAHYNDENRDLIVGRITKIFNMSVDHTYILDLCDNNIELENMRSNCDESDVGDFVDSLDELIIACVQSYPHLYSKGNKNYKDNMMKEKSWEEIAQTCSISVIEVQQRWKRLKDRYSKQRRLNEHATRSGSAAQTIKQWPLFDNMKFMEKHIQRRRTFSNVPLKFNTTSQDIAKKLSFGHQNESRESTPTFQVRQNMVQSIQDLKRIQNTCSENKLKNQTQGMFPEDQLERNADELSRDWQNLEPAETSAFKNSARVRQTSISLKSAGISDVSDISQDSSRLSKGWQNFETSVTNTLKNSVGVPQTSMSSLKSACTSDISGDNSRSTPFTAIHENFELSSEISDHTQNNFSSSQLDKSYSADEQARSTTSSISSSPSVAKKCFVGGTQRKKRNNPDLLETSFISTANILKEYVLEKREKKENVPDLSADEYLAKFIISRLLCFPEEQRDEKRKKIIEILLTK